MINALDAVLADAVARGLAPSAVAGAAFADGRTWLGAAGPREAGGAAPLETDAIFRLHSLTKAIGGACAAVAADEGSLDLDAPVARYVPLFAELPVLAGWRDDRPVLRPQRRAATVRQLAAHTAGCVYDIWSADHRRYQLETGARRAATGARAALAAQPLAFDAGEGWGYGEGVDWLGLVLEAATGQPIDGFCRDRLLAPLGMADTAFTLGDSATARLAPVHVASDEGFRVKRQRPAPPGDMWGMGHALHGSAGDYLRFLRMIMAGGVLDGRRVMRQSAARLLLDNQIGALTIAPMRTAVPAVACDLDLFPGVTKRHSLGGMIVTQDVPGRRSAGSVGWAGILNCWWWIDPRAGVAAVILTQVQPFAHPRALALLDRIERAVHAAAPLARGAQMG